MEKRRRGRPLGSVKSVDTSAFIRLAEHWAGPQWQSAVARLLKCHRVYVWRWAHGLGDVPDIAFALVWEAVCARHEADTLFMATFKSPAPR